MSFECVMLPTCICLIVICVHNVGRQVLRSSGAVQASLEASLLVSLPSTALTKCSDMLQHILPAEAHSLAIKLPQFLGELQELLQRTGTSDVVRASQEAVSKLISAALAVNVPNNGQQQMAQLIADLHLDAEAAQQFAANSLSAKSAPL
jgi:hypothetical protein